jgi:hypothetical protein
MNTCNVAIGGRESLTENSDFDWRGFINGTPKLINFEHLVSRLIDCKLRQTP